MQFRFHHATHLCFLSIFDVGEVVELSGWLVRAQNIDGHIKRNSLIYRHREFSESHYIRVYTSEATGHTQWSEGARGIECNIDDKPGQSGDAIVGEMRVCDRVCGMCVCVSQHTLLCPGDQTRAFCYLLGLMRCQ